MTSTKIVTAGQLQAGQTIQLRKGAVRGVWDDSRVEGASWDDLDYVPVATDLRVDAVEPVPLTRHRKPYGRRSRAYVITSGGRTFRLGATNKVVLVEEVPA